jgi:hypothetical protein
MAHGDNIVRLTSAQVLELTVVLSSADLEGRSVRIWTGADAQGPWFKYDIGGGWTPPLRGLTL